MKIKRILSSLLRSSARLKLSFIIHNHVSNIKIRKFLDIILAPIGIVNFFYLTVKSKKTSNFKYQISIVCIVKNESSYIKEWIKYHQSIGVNHFYIYDNDSDDDLPNVLKEFGDNVTYTKINGRLRQLDAYNNALNRFSNQTKYLAVIDADEFIYCSNENHTLLPILNSYFKNSKVGGLAVNWVIYGSSHFKTRPTGLVSNNFIYRSKVDFEKNHFIKTICNPRKVFDFTLSHAANYLPGYYAIDEKYNYVPWAKTKKVNISKIRLNHYYSKSREEFLKKRNRGSGEVLAPRRLDEFDEHDKNNVFDDSMRIYNKEHNLN